MAQNYEIYAGDPTSSPMDQTVKPSNNRQTTRSNMNDRIHIVVGIDPGVHTGFCVIDNGDLTDVETYTFTEAQAWLLNCIKAYADPEKQGCCTLELVIEDPRGQYVPYNKREPKRIKGVGSVERDAKLWIEFAEFYGIKYRTVKPGKYRNIDAKTFKAWTGWKDRTSEHARAAAMMVWGGKTNR